MSIVIERSVLRDFERSSRLEWLETNGLGGWAMSTVSGAHSRRYHGLLVAATRPPVERMVLLSRLDETVRAGGRSIELGSSRFPGAVHPRGFERLVRFERDLFPVFEYDLTGVVDGGVLRKTVAAISGENTVVVLYELVAGPAEGVELELRPFYAVRGYHELGTAGRSFRREATLSDDVLRLSSMGRRARGPPSRAGRQFRGGARLVAALRVQEEIDRGFDGHEDLFTPGVLRVELPARGQLGVVVSTDPAAGRDAVAILGAERLRRERLVDRVPALAPPGAGATPDWVRTLAIAADQFLVRRGEHDTTVIAGYPWFTDWGRDTMISLPGLCLATGRHAEARGILRAFAAAVDRGMLPNRFPDRGEPPEYNTVDATLWFFVAIRRYLDATGDEAFVRDELLGVLEDILAWHRRGTRHGIRVDDDGLLYAGEPGVQLTWMDARVGDWVVTPRRGKPVEIQALWYNALRILAAARESVRPCGEERQARGRRGAGAPPFRRAVLERRRRLPLRLRRSARRRGGDRARRSRAAQPGPGPGAPVRVARSGARGLGPRRDRSAPAHAGRPALSRSTARRLPSSVRGGAGATRRRVPPGDGLVVAARTVHHRSGARARRRGPPAGARSPRARRRPSRRGVRRLGLRDLRRRAAVYSARVPGTGLGRR